jgi:hypothetical protein
MFTALMMLASAASNPPSSTTYLDCTTFQPGSKSTVHWQLALNEQEGTVDVQSDANGGAGAGRKSASFTANSVLFLGFTLVALTSQ